MSSSGRDGIWMLPRLFRALAIMGEVKLDLTRVRLGPGTSTIEVLAIMGEVRILAPHNVRIECDVTPALGSVDVKRVPDTVPADGAPLIRITGSAWLGAVRIKIVDPSAPTWVDTLKKRWAGY
jgi:hypothetical protein